MRGFWGKVKDKIWLQINFYSCDLNSLTIPDASDTENILTPNKIFCYREMRPDDLEEMFCRYPKEISERKYHILKDRLSEQGKKAFVAATADGNIPAAYFCASIVDTYIGGIETTLTVSLDEVYLFDFYVFAAFRGQQIHGKSVRYCLESYKRAGYKRALGCVYNTNDTAIRSIQKAGFRYDYSIIRIMPLGVTFVKSKNLS